MVLASSISLWKTTVTSSEKKDDWSPGSESSDRNHRVGAASKWTRANICAYKWQHGYCRMNSFSYGWHEFSVTKTARGGQVTLSQLSKIFGMTSIVEVFEWFILNFPLGPKWQDHAAMPRSPCTLAIGWLCLCDWEVKKSHVGVDGQEVILCVTYKYVTLRYVHGSAVIVLWLFGLLSWEFKH